MLLAAVLLSILIIVSSLTTSEFSNKLSLETERNLLEYDDINLDLESTHSAFIAALKNKHLIFFGDSVTRYQYVSLIYFLKYKQFVNDTQRPNPLWVKDFNGFNEYYAYTYKLLLPAWCDCDKGIGDSTENRYYYDPITNIRVTLVLSFKNNCEGHWSDYSDFDKYRMPKKPISIFWQLELTKCFTWAKNLYIPQAHKYAVNLNVFDNITEGFQTIGILNQGHHPHSLRNLSFATRLAKAGTNTFDKFIWKTTTGFLSIKDTYFSWRPDGTNRNEYDYFAHDNLMCSLPGVICYNATWTQYLNKTYYKDNVHFIPSVYKMLDIQLLKGLQSNSNNF